MSPTEEAQKLLARHVELMAELGVAPTVRAPQVHKAVAPGADTYDMLGAPKARDIRKIKSCFSPMGASFAKLGVLLGAVEFDGEGEYVAVNLARLARADGHRIFFIGNGGSAGIASHMAADWAKAGGFKAMCFNEAASITALGNDIGFEVVFARPLELHGARGDILFAISSSGMSKDILIAAQKAKDIGMTLVTLSGFSPSNQLRQMGDLNFYVPSDKYGLVEVAHHAVLHAILDQVVDGARAG